MLHNCGELPGFWVKYDCPAIVGDGLLLPLHLQYLSKITVNVGGFRHPADEVLKICFGFVQPAHVEEVHR